MGLAYLLWAFFGLFGLHRLYLGRSLSAAGMAAITLLSVPLIWSGLACSASSPPVPGRWPMRC